MASVNFGYARISTKQQNEARQIEALQQYVDERHIYVDKISGRETEREGLGALKKALRTGDVLYIYELDRIGRTKQIIKDELEYFKNEGIIVKILDVPTTMMDFSQFGSMQKAIMEMVNNLLLEVYSTQAEHEIAKIKKRQQEGIDLALHNGVKFGRPKIPINQEFINVYERWKAKELKAVEAMVMLKMTKATFYNRVREYEKRYK